MNTVAKRIVKEMLSENIIVAEEAELYEYSCIVWLEKIIVYGIWATIAIVMNATFESFVFLITFITIRRYSGGFHMNSFWSCLISSVFVEVFLIIIIIPSHGEFFPYFSCVTALATVIILSIGAINCENMHWTDCELSKMKRSSRAAVGRIVVVALVFVYMDIPIGNIIAIFYGIVLSCILLLIEYVRQNILNVSFCKK